MTAQRMAAEGLTETRRAVHALRTDHRPLPPDATVALLRTAQEALVNVAKHAAGQDVAVRLDYGDSDVRLTVDNHVNPPRSDVMETVTTNGGYGLTGMRERLRLLDGTLVAGPATTGGSWWPSCRGARRTRP